MKKQILLYFLMMLSVLTMAQKDNLDSLYLFNEINLSDAHIKKYRSLDSLQTFQLKNIITARLNNNKPVEFKVALANLSSFISLNMDAEIKNRFINSSNYVELLLKNYTQDISERLQLLKQKKRFNSFIETSSNIFEQNRQDSIFRDILKEIVEIEREEKGKLDLAYYEDCYSQAMRYRSIDTRMAENLLCTSLSVKFWNIEKSSSYREIIRVQETAALALLDLRRGNLKMLEVTFLEISDFVDEIHKQYIEELGGTYPPPSWFERETTAADRKIKIKKN